MTSRKIDPKVLGEPFVPRPHFACRVRLDLADWMRSQCAAFNCSQGVFLEILITKARAENLVTQDDVFQYDARLRGVQRYLSDGN